MTTFTSYINQMVYVEIDRPLNTRHPKYGFRYEVNYGYIPGTTNKDGEEIDVYILGVSHPLKTFCGKCIAVIHRTNDNDDKLIVIPPEIKDIPDKEIKKQTYFQERFFESIVIRNKK